jgi:hypothetical protein
MGLGLLKGAFAARARKGAEIARLKALARTLVGAGEEVAFSVNEIACLDPSCPGTETVLLIMEPGRRTRAVKVMKSLEDVTETDLREALSAQK